MSDSSFCPVCTVTFKISEGKCPFCQGRLKPRAATSPIGTLFGEKYFVTDEIGHGSTSAVYRARQRTTNRDVAIKVLHPDRFDNPRVVARFYREAQAASQLNHPNIVTLFDFDTTEDGLLYLVLEHLDGALLAEALAPSRPLAITRALDVAMQVCDALVEAHSKGIVHRDLKPSNLMLLPRAAGEQVKVFDFGLAKILDPRKEQPITTARDFFGTAAYMSPEQVLNQQLDWRTDLYSLGIILFEMLTGRPPFQEVDPVETAEQHLKRPVPRLSELNPALAQHAVLEQLLTRALAKKPTARFADAGGFKRRLLAAQEALMRAPSEPTETEVSVALLAEEMPPAALHDDALERTSPILTLPALPAQAPRVPSVADEVTVPMERASVDDSETIPMPLTARARALKAERIEDEVTVPARFSRHTETPDHELE